MALWADAYYKSEYPSVCLSVGLSACPSVCPSVCLFTLRYRLNLFLSSSSQKLNVQKDLKNLESLGKSNEKKWSQNWKLSLIKGVKLPCKKKFGFEQILPHLPGFLVLVFLTPFNSLLSPTSQSPMSHFFRFSESLGKSRGKMWSQIWKLCS